MANLRPSHSDFGPVVVKRGSKTGPKNGSFLTHFWDPIFGPWRARPGPGRAWPAQASFDVYFGLYEAKIARFGHRWPKGVKKGVPKRVSGGPLFGVPQTGFGRGWFAYRHFLPISCSRDGP